MKKKITPKKSKVSNKKLEIASKMNGTKNNPPTKNVGYVNPKE